MPELYVTYAEYEALKLRYALACEELRAVREELQRLKEALGAV